jgi:NitT/TauT family transport system permease protein
MPADTPLETGGVATLDEITEVEAGLDALETTAPAGLPWHRRLRAAVLPPLVAFVAFVAFWQLLFLAEVQPPDVLPSPGQVWDAFVDGWSDGSIPQAMRNSVGRGLLGFALAIVIAVPLGLVVARVTPLRTALTPILSALQTLPSVAWVPAATLWFGASDATVYVVVLLGGVPSIAMGLISGLDQTPALYLRVGQMLGFRRAGLARHILLPAAAPAFLAGLRQGWAFAWRSLLAAELIIAAADPADGLGRLLQSGREAGAMTEILAAVFAILIVGLLIESLVFAPLERRMLRVRGLAGAAR